MRQGELPIPGRRHHPHRRQPPQQPPRRATALDLSRHAQSQGRGLRTSLTIDDAILDFDDPDPRRSTRVLDAGDNPHCQHLAISSGPQARRRTFVPRKTTAFAAFHPTRQAGRRGCQFPAARTLVRGACRDCRITFSPARRGLVPSLVWVPCPSGTPPRRCGRQRPL
jgi:hypothetical protein